MKAYLMRLDYQQDRVLGRMVVFNGTMPIWSGVTLEPPDRNNQKNVSCVKKGLYKVFRHTSPKFKDCFKLDDANGRKHILIHVGNFTRNTEGCILVGTDYKDLDGDGRQDIANSRRAFNALMRIDADEFELEIV